jgi:ribose/xylose/arabinose/galactoside ABC-type transport system permease subunit
VDHLGRILIFLGLLIAAIGAAILLLGKTGLPLGRLPGDFSWRGKNTSFYFPLGTCILLSVVLSLVLWILARLRK